MTLPVSTNMNDMYNQIVSVLKTVPDPNGAAPVFQNTDGSWNVYDGVQESANTPAAFIVPAPGQPSVFATSIENYRSYSFFIFIKIDTEVATYAATRQNMRLIEDSVLDAIDRSSMLNGYADMLQAASTQWIEEAAGNGVNIVAPVQISAQRTVEVK